MPGCPWAAPSCGGLIALAWVWRHRRAVGRRPGFRGGLDAHQPPAFAWFPSPPGSAGLLGGGCITPRTLTCPRRWPSRSPRWDRRTGQRFGYCCRCRDPGSASASHGDFSSALGKPVPVFPHPARSLGSGGSRHGVCVQRAGVTATRDAAQLCRRRGTDPCRVLSSTFPLALLPAEGCSSAPRPCCSGSASAL